MKKYEITFIIGEDQPDPKAKEIAKSISKEIEAGGGKIEKEVFWGKRKLAYKIEKNTFGYYFVYIFHADPSFISIFTHDLNLNDKILRYLVVDFIEKTNFFDEPGKEPEDDRTRNQKAKKARKPLEEIKSSDEKVEKKEIKDSSSLEATKDREIKEIKEEKAEKPKEEAIEEKVEPEITKEKEKAGKEIEPEKEKQEADKEEDEEKVEERKPLTEEDRKKQLEDRLAEILKDEE